MVYPANVFKKGYPVESGELLLFQEKLRAREQRVCEREQDLVTREKRVADREVRWGAVPQKKTRRLHNEL